MTNAFVSPRLREDPFDHLGGTVRFREIELLVGPGVFVPQPETSSVVDWAVTTLRELIADGIEAPQCVDLCSGAGTMALSIAAEVPEAQVYAVELDPGALVWTRRNARHNGLAVDIRQGDAANALPELNGRVDVLVSNPPYVATSELPSVAPEVRDHTPEVALIAGSDGLDIVRAIESTGRRLLRPGGHVIVEHSDRQGTTAPAVFADAGVWQDVSDHVDHLDRPRFVTARRR